MPYRSASQERFFHSAGAKEAGISEAQVHEFDSASKGMKLPGHAGGGTLMKKCSKCGQMGKGSVCPKCGGKMEMAPMSAAMGKDMPKYAHGTMPDGGRYKGLSRYFQKRYGGRGEDEHGKAKPPWKPQAPSSAPSAPGPSLGRPKMPGEATTAASNAAAAAAALAKRNPT